MSPSSRLVAKALFRFYRPVALWFLSVLTLGTAVAMTIVTRFTDPTFSLWLLVVASAVKYWTLIVGIMLVSMHLRQFVSNGVTRRDFVIGSGVFGLTIAVAFAIFVPLGHAVESALMVSIGGAPPGYPAFSFSTAISEFGQVLPTELAFLASGLAVAAGFYRYGGWPGILFLVPGLIPMGVAEGLIAVGDDGRLDTRLLPYAVVLLVSLVVSALVAVLYQRQMRDIPIRRAAG
jgi:hypothetical protein